MTSGEPPKATKKGLFAWLPTAAKETPSIAAQEPPVPKRSEFGFWSRWTYSYSNDLFKRGSKRVLNAAEYPGIEDDDESQKLSKTLMDLWEIESKTPRPALWKCLPKMFGRWYALAGVVYFLEVGGKIGEALVLGGLLSWFESPNAPTRDGLGYAFGLVALAFLRAILHHIGFFVTMRVGMQVRVTFIAAIYRKCMSLSIASTSSSGMIVNMVSNDVQRFEDLAPFLHFLWIAPLEVILVLYFIYLQISWAAFAAVGSLLLFIPLQGFFAKQFGGIRIRAVRYRDERIKTLSDMLSGILLVKLYGWEDPFMKKIVELRNEELKAIRQASLIRATNDAVFFASSGKYFDLIIFICSSTQCNLISRHLAFCICHLHPHGRVSHSNQSLCDDCSPAVYSIGYDELFPKGCSVVLRVSRFVEPNPNLYANDWNGRGEGRKRRR